MYRSSGMITPTATPGVETDEASDPQNVLSRQNQWRRDGRWGLMTRTIAHYQRLVQIGEGTYGQVYMARCVHTGREVALKKIRVQHGAYQGFPTGAIREIKIMKKLRHPNMVELYEVLSSKGVERLDTHDEREEDKRKRERDETAAEKGKRRGNTDRDTSVADKGEKSNTFNNNKDRHIDTREGFKGNLFLALEYVSHDLTGLMDMHYRFSAVQVKSIFRQLLSVLSYIHHNKYVHRDLKCSNILITSNFELKLADFGLARSIDDTRSMFENDNSSYSGSTSKTGPPLRQDLTNKVITLWYRPPELLLGESHYGTCVDMWSAGCILAEITFGKPILMGKTEQEQLTLILDLLGTPNEKWAGHQNLKLLKSGEMVIGDPRPSQLRKKYEKKGKMGSSAIDLLEKLLELDPTRRITAERALSSRYFLEEPRAPNNPASLGKIDLGAGIGQDGHFHEFQTKKKRREAKAIAETAKQEASKKGLSSSAADKVYNEVYEAEIRSLVQNLGNSTNVKTKTGIYRSERKDQNATFKESVPNPSRLSDQTREYRDGRKLRYDGKPQHQQPQEDPAGDANKKRIRSRSIDIETRSHDNPSIEHKSLSEKRRREDQK